MCLSSVIRETTLRKDLVCYKLVWDEEDNNGCHKYYTGFRNTMIYPGRNGLAPGEPKLWTDEPERFSDENQDWYFPNAPRWRKNSYQSCYHCWMQLSTAHKMFDIMQDENGNAIAECIIPAGTRVLLGKQWGYDVVVTPVFNFTKIVGRYFGDSCECEEVEELVA
jgi:hypothetical protein